MQVATSMMFFTVLSSPLLAQELDRQNAAVAESVLAKSGLHLASDSENLATFVKTQGAKTSCEVIQVQWISLPGQKMMPAMEAEKLHLPQTFSLGSRSPLKDCEAKFYRTLEFTYTQRIFIFGTTDSGEIHGLYIAPDPRSFIVECPEFWGEKSTPQTKCGEFFVPEVSFSIRLPQDPGITQLLFFRRRFTTPQEWSLEKLGALKLTSDK